MVTVGYALDADGQKVLCGTCEGAGGAPARGGSYLTKRGSARAKRSSHRHLLPSPGAIMCVNCVSTGPRRPRPLWERRARFGSNSLDRQLDRRLDRRSADARHGSVAFPQDHHPETRETTPGLAIPLQLQRKDTKNIDDQLETKLDQIGIAALADDILRQEAKPGDLEKLSEMVLRRASAESTARRRRAGVKVSATKAPE